MENVEKTTTIAIVNQKKEEPAKPRPAQNLGVGLAREGKKVLLVDATRRGRLPSASGCSSPMNCLLRFLP